MQQLLWFRSSRWFAALGGTLMPFLAAAPSHAQTPLPAGSEFVYDDTLENGWQDYSWATVNTANSSPFHGGSGKSVRVDAAAYEAFYVYHGALDTAPYASLTFWIHGGTTGGQSLQVQAIVNGNTPLAAVNVPAPQANAWQQITFSLASLGVANRTDFQGFWIKNRTGNTLPTFYVDDVALAANPPPATIALQVNASSVIRQIDPRFFGVNVAVWDDQLGTATSSSLLSNIGTTVLRFPGGAISDIYDWQTNRTVAVTVRGWESAFPVMAKQAETLGAQPYITVNYGSGTPEQAAAWVAYANGSTSSAASLGTDSKGRNWRTVGYWASMRAASPLANDDGFNFLRVSHAAGYGFKYWEVGNENYGSWEYDEHSASHDPSIYAQNFATFRQKMLAVDPTIKIGVPATLGEDSFGNGQHAVTNPNDGTMHTGWTPVMLATLRNLGALPHFMGFHGYPQEPGAESDSGLLAAGSALPAASAASLRQMLTDYVGGTAGAAIELGMTEMNDVTTDPGKQSVSLVDGLFLADVTASLAETEFNTCVWWDFRNAADTTQNNSDSLYGTRKYGDYGLVAKGDQPDMAANAPYPSYYGAKLLTHWAAGGDRTVAASSNYTPLGIHAALRANGDLCLLVINKSADTDLPAQITLNGFTPGSSTAAVYSYGKPNDLNKIDLTTSSLSGVGTTFAATFPAYSMTVIDLAKPAAAASPYVVWQRLHFTQVELTKSDISGDSADPDKDHVPNLMEYAFNLDPKKASTAGVPVASTVTINGSKYNALTFTVVKAATDINYIVEVSSDGSTWTSGTKYTAVHKVVDQKSTQIVTMRDKTAATFLTTRYIRIRITKK